MASGIVSKVSAWVVFIYVLLSSCCVLYLGLFPCWAFIRVLDKRLYYRLFQLAMSSWCIMFATLAERWSPVKLHIYGELPPPDKSVLIISNHRCNLDWVYVWSLALRVGARQVGYFSAVAKSVLRKIPIWGWAFKLDGFLFLKRNFDQDIDHINSWIRGMVESPRLCWLVLYPEGTRYTAKNKERSDEVAKKLGLQIFEGELLLPRTKGFVTLAQGLRKKFYGVLDMTIVYTGRGGGLLPFQSLGTNALWEVFGGDAPVADVHINLKLHRMEVLPESDDGLKDWCMARWMEKQELLKEFTAKGKFPVGYHGVDERPSNLKVQLGMCALYGAASCLFVHLAATSYLFRAYLLWSSVVAAAVAFADAPTSTL